MLDPDRLVYVVVGAQLRAEVGDRPIAYRLAREVDARLAGRGAAVVVSDVWYLNQSESRAQPTISVGAPDDNALAAHLSDRLPSVLAVEGRLVVQVDLDGGDAIASCWGAGAEHTTAAVDLFVERYLDGFLSQTTATWGA